MTNDASKKILSGLETVLRRGLISARLNPKDNLALTLQKIKEGNSDALGELAPHIVDQTRSQLYAPEFFARDPKEVAKDLCGSSIFYLLNDKANGGRITHTAAYSTSNKDKKVAEAKPGTIGCYSSEGRDIIIISAHEGGKSSTVALWSINYGAEKLTMSETAEKLKLRDCTNKVIGEDAPWLLVARNPSIENIGELYVRSTGKEKGSLASYKLE